MRLIVAFPWRPTPDREPAYRCVRGWWAEHFPQAHVIEIDTGHDQFNLAACRNEAVRRCAELGGDVVVISDADVLLQPGSTSEAIAAAGDHLLHYPFDRYFYAGYDGAIDGNQGGCVVVTPEGWGRFGGQDERFHGWGGEDGQLAASAHCLSGIVEHPGLAVGLWHRSVRDVGSSRWRPNSTLATRYWQAKDDPAEMRSLIAERT